MKANAYSGEKNQKDVDRAVQIIAKHIDKLRT